MLAIVLKCACILRTMSWEKEVAELLKSRCDCLWAVLNSPPLYPDLRNFRSPIYESVLQISDALTRSLPPHAFSCCFPHLPFCLLVIHEIVLLTAFLPFPV